MLGTELHGSVGQHGPAAQHVAEAVEDLRERMHVVQAAAVAQLAAVGSIQQELVDVANATQDGVMLMDGMREAVDPLGARAQELERSAARFRLPA